MKIVSRISPIEATRYLDGSKTQKNRADEKAEKCHRFLHGIGKCDKQSKRTIATILTMGLS